MGEFVHLQVVFELEGFATDFTDELLLSQVQLLMVFQVRQCFKLLVTLMAHISKEESLV